MVKKKKKKGPSEVGIEAVDVASLVLVRRQPSRRTEWAFTERAVGAPLQAAMSASLCAIERGNRAACQNPDWWWIMDDSLTAISSELTASNFCIIDHFLNVEFLRALRDEVAAVHASGKLQLSRLAGGRSGSMQTYSHAAVRGDHVAWFDGEEAGTWPERTLNQYLQKVDTLVAQLGPQVSQLGSIASRSKAMVTCYPGGGARYVRHCDNSCDTGRGERCNGRRLTAILYLNDGWSPLHGGELRLYAPFAPKGVPPIADVAPIANRLILFYADYRVPHEVLPAHMARLAITTWYFDRDEHTAARRKGEAADQTDTYESEAIEREIARFEERFGEGAKRHDRAAIRS
jgi:hypoxia-inducible factor (prolyl hydroxylase)